MKASLCVLQFGTAKPSIWVYDQHGRARRLTGPQDLATLPDDLRKSAIRAMVRR